MPDPAERLTFTVSSENASNTIYANHFQVLASGNELFLDVFQISPIGATGDDVDRTREINPKHLVRIIVPLPTIKGLATVIANVAAHMEQQLGYTLPNLREPSPDDKIVIWK